MVLDDLLFALTRFNGWIPFENLSEASYVEKRWLHVILSLISDARKKPLALPDNDCIKRIPDLSYSVLRSNY